MKLKQLRLRIKTRSALQPLNPFFEYNVYLSEAHDMKRGNCQRINDV